MNTLNARYTNIHKAKGSLLLWNRPYDYAQNLEDVLAVVMTPRELTQQAFKLYDGIRIKSSSTPIHSDLLVRLHSIQLHAFLRYKRRLKIERCSSWKQEDGVRLT